MKKFFCMNSNIRFSLITNKIILLSHWILRLFYLSSFNPCLNGFYPSTLLNKFYFSSINNVLKRFYFYNFNPNIMNTVNLWIALLGLTWPTTNPLRYLSNWISLSSLYRIALSLNPLLTGSYFPNARIVIQLNTN